MAIDWMALSRCTHLTAFPSSLLPAMTLRRVLTATLSAGLLLTAALSPLAAEARGGGGGGGGGRGFGGGWGGAGAGGRSWGGGDYHH